MRKLFLRASMTLLLMVLTTATAWAATENLGGHNFTVETDDEGSYYKIDCADALIALANYVNAAELKITQRRSARRDALLAKNRPLCV